jgi:predicted KAP-like P-loop ATPase
MLDNLFSSERPINTLAEDELGLSGFATAVSKVVGQWAGRDSLVLAIYGPWGSGKTSLKNMILDALQQQSAKTMPLEFNPWEWAGKGI